MKYEFKKIDEDTTELIYKDKKFTIKKDVDLIKMMQECNVKARTKLMIDLTKAGMSKKDLTIERHEGNKTYYDNSNFLSVEEAYIQQASQEVYDDICKKYCGMNLTELMSDIGLDFHNNSEMEKFGLDLTRSLTNEIKSFPREAEEII